MNRLRIQPHLWLLALTAIACSRSDAPNLLLVTLDTTRADHLGAYGYAAARTPALDAFAQKSALYERAYATSSWTLPSHASLFTGLLPMQHGAQTTPDGVSEPLGYAVRPLGASFETLAERLADAGYRTAAVVAGPALSRELGVAQGFHSYDDDLSGPGESYRGRLAETVADRAIAAIEGTDERPWFVFVNFFDPHAPYRPPAPHDAGLPEVDSGPLTRALAVRLSGHGEPSADWEGETLAALQAGYDAEIAYMDLHLGRLLAAVDLSETWIAITSDHGESFGEHGYLSHGANLYEDNVRVPLLVHEPGETARRIRAPLSNRSVFAGLLTAAGLEPPAEAPRLGVPSEWIFTEVGASDANVRLLGSFFDRRLRSLHVPPHKLIRSSRGGIEVYDLARDPQEQEDLTERHPSLRAALGLRLDGIARAHPPLYDAAASTELSPAVEESLRQLGYLE